MTHLYLCYLHCKPPNTTISGTVQPNMPGVQPQLCPICLPLSGANRPVVSAV